MSPSTWIATGLRLGIANVARVATHRLLKRTGAYRALLPGRTDAFEFSPHLGESSLSVPADVAAVAQADALLAGRASFFSAHTFALGSPPDWFLNPFLGKRHPRAAEHWSRIPDYDPDIGDIKIIWEMSRASWAVTFARAWCVSREARYLHALRDWLGDWWRCNPPFVGPNWMCGQETALRLINVLLAAHLLDAESLGPFVDAHCSRIGLTTSYALGQDNNHGISEAAALFMGGTWLAREGRPGSRAQRWAACGRRLLDALVARLVLPDGSFSQHSMTYHRLLLDTLSIAETWRAALGVPPFERLTYERAAAAARWLAAMVEVTTGDTPNLGANDGSQPFRFDSSAHRDFRPALQLAARVFLGRPALGPGPWDLPAAWLRVAAEEAPLLPRPDGVFQDGGYVVMTQSSARVFVRAPTARFRPSQADALHVDFWWRGLNLLRDGGTYGYLGGGKVGDHLASVAGHNTVQFDRRDQMPRLGPFLYGAWIRVDGSPVISRGPSGQTWSGSYRDCWGGHHRRTLTLGDDRLIVVDEVSGFRINAVLRWRLAPWDWSLRDNECVAAGARISIESPRAQVRLVEGSESRHYLEKTAVPVLEVEVPKSPATITTTVILR